MVPGSGSKTSLVVALPNREKYYWTTLDWPALAVGDRTLASIFFRAHCVVLQYDTLAGPYIYIYIYNDG